MLRNYSIQIATLLLVLFVTAAAIIIPLLARAQTIPVTDLTGYAWSENIGWISMSCKDGGSSGQDICGTRNYGVKINADRTVTGYAWSEHIGWIRFGGLSSFPSGGGTTAANATVSGTYPNLTFSGWARACAGTVGSPTYCGNMDNSTAAPGWDGWISLGGTGYSVRTNTAGMVSGSWAWGSTVVGWIDMSTFVNVGTPTAALTGSGCTIPIGEGTCDGTFSWSFTNVTTPNVRNAATNVTYGTNPTVTSATHPIRAGVNLIEARDGSAVLRTLTVTGLCASGSAYNAGSGICELIPALPPTIAIAITPSIVRSGERATINWTINGLADGSCEVSGPGADQTNLTTTGSALSVPLTNYSQFTLSCTGSYGTVTTTSAVEVIPVAQEV